MEQFRPGIYRIESDDVLKGQHLPGLNCLSQAIRAQIMSDKLRVAGFGARMNMLKGKVLDNRPDLAHEREQKRTEKYRENAVRLRHRRHQCRLCHRSLHSPVEKFIYHLTYEHFPGDEALADVVILCRECYVLASPTMGAEEQSYILDTLFNCLKEIRDAHLSSLFHTMCNTLFGNMFMFGNIRREFAQGYRITMDESAELKMPPTMSLKREDSEQLQAVATPLEEVETLKPARVGKRWDLSESYDLIGYLMDGYTFSTIAKKFERTVKGVRTRAERLWHPGLKYLRPHELRDPTFLERLEEFRKWHLDQRGKSS